MKKFPCQIYAGSNEIPEGSPTVFASVCQSVKSTTTFNSLKNTKHGKIGEQNNLTVPEI